jgi:rhamnogalacturonyl hydrolase YesR
MIKFVAAAVSLGVSGLLGLGVAAPAGTAVAAEPDLPSHTSVVVTAKRALDYYRPTYATTTLTPRNGWSWGTYFQGVHELYRHAGDARYQADGMAWGRSNAWQLNTVETNPDTIKAGEVYYRLHEIDPTASLDAMDAKMSADLTGLPLSRYDWIDALFMGLPNWALWSARTGSPAYLDKLDALYRWARDQGATGSRCGGRVPTQPGLYDASAGLWYRDCRFVGAKDVNGLPVFWSRGNGWVIAAMADVLQSLPAGDPRAATYAGMLRTMAASLAPLQGADGFWRSSLADPALFPQPETSGTALITYALGYGVRSGVLDSATYRPVVARAWQGLTTVALQPSGFLSGCQPPGVTAAAPFTAPAPRTAPTATSSGTVNADSPPYCVGAFLMAAAQLARLTPSLTTGRPVTASSQQTGNEAVRAVDGDVSTRWSASGFPQSVTVDLGSTRTVGGTMVVPYRDRAYRYRIESSADRVTWRLLVDRSANTTPGSQPVDVGAVQARYVRLTVLGVSGDPTTWTSIQELAVYSPPVASTTYARDTFGRAVPDGLGTADLGGTWAVTGPVSGYAVGSGVGRMRLDSAGTGRAAYLPSVSATDVDLTVDWSSDKPASGGATYVALAARHVANDDYRVKVKQAASGAVTVAVERVVGGVETALSSRTVTGLVAGPGDPLRVRLLVGGAGTTTVSAKVWRAATAEPGAWQVTATDTTPRLQAPGAVGLSTYLSGTATNAPVTVSFDDLTASSVPR